MWQVFNWAASDILNNILNSVAKTVNGLSIWTEGSKKFRSIHNPNNPLATDMENVPYIPV